MRNSVLQTVTIIFKLARTLPFCLMVAYCTFQLVYQWPVLLGLCLCLSQLGSRTIDYAVDYVIGFSLDLVQAIAYTVGDLLCGVSDDIVPIFDVFRYLLLIYLFACQLLTLLYWLSLLLLPLPLLLLLMLL